MAMKREDVLACREAIRQGKTVSITRLDTNLNKNITEVIVPQSKDGHFNDPNVVLPEVFTDDQNVWNLPSYHEWYQRNTDSMAETITRHIGFRAPNISDELVLSSILMKMI